MEKSPVVWLGARGKMEQGEFHSSFSSRDSNKILNSKFSQMGMLHAKGKGEMSDPSKEAVISYTEQSLEKDPHPKIHSTSTREGFTFQNRDNRPIDEHADTQRLKIDIPGKSPEKKTFPLLSDHPTLDRKIVPQENGLPKGSKLPKPSSAQLMVLPNESPESVNPSPQPMNTSSTIQRKTLASLNASTMPISDGENERTGSPAGFHTKESRSHDSKLEYGNDLNQTPQLRSKPSPAMSLRIERLQQAVQELTMKKSRPQLADQTEPQKGRLPQLPPSPPQPVVVVQSVPRRIKTPDAFWERSYLGRMHLRLLR